MEFLVITQTSLVPISIEMMLELLYISDLNPPINGLNAQILTILLVNLLNLSIYTYITII
jgi:hypothetical protein